MSVRLDGDVVFLEGWCHVEEAEPLANHLQATGRMVDLSGCRGVHTALVQALLIYRPKIRGETGDAILDQLLNATLLS